VVTTWKEEVRTFFSWLRDDEVSTEVKKRLDEKEKEKG